MTEKRKTRKNNLRQLAEDKIAQQVSEQSAPSSNDRLKLGHELAVRQIEIQLQNEELRQSQESLHEALARYQDLFDNAPVGYFILDSHNMILDLNQTAAQMLGIPKSKLREKRFAQFIAKGNEHYYYDMAVKSFKERKPQEFDLEMIRGDDSSFFAHLNIIPVQDHAGKFNQLRVTAIDISERKKAETALKESEERLELAQTGADIGVWDWEVTTGRSHPSALSQRLFGVEPGTIKSIQDWRKTVYPEDLVKFEAERDKAIINHQPFDLEYRILYPSGEIHWINAKGKAYYDEKEKPVRVIGITIDITERKKAEEALKESEKKYHDLFNNMTEAFFLGEIILNSCGKLCDFRYLEVNPAWEKWTGFSRDHAIGKTYRELVPGAQVGIIKMFGKVAISGKAETLEFYSPYTKSWINAYSFRPSQGRFATIMADVTKRKQAEEALAKAKDELEAKVRERTEQLQEAYDEIIQSQKNLKEANKQLKQYAAKITRVQEEERKRIAYELHDDTAQYLGILKMQIGALAESDEVQSPKIKERLQFLIKDADRAFNDVRRYSHELRPVVLEHQGLAAAIEQIADDYRKLGQLSVEAQIEGMEPKLSEEVKLGIFRIAQESINNIRKHSKATRAVIELRFNHTSVLMTVSDNGEGFNTKEALKRSGGKGSLGLLSMKERAELINADLKIESEPGNGTKVILRARL